MGHVDVDVILLGSGAAALADLEDHRAGDDVTRREVLDRGGVALHEALALGVAQDSALTADGLGDEDAQAGQAGRVELVELHVLQGQALAEHHGHAVTGEGVGVGGGLVHPARAAGGEHGGLGMEDVEVAGGELVGHTAGGHRALGGLRQAEVEDVELVEELDVVLDAVLVERLQDHVTRAVGRVAGTTHGRLAVVTRVAAEAALVDLALGRPVERQAHVLEVDDRGDGLLGHDLRRVLVDEVVAALDRVEGVPLPVVLLDVREGGAHAALRGTGVGARGIELGEHRGAGTRGGLDGGAHARAAGAGDDDVVLVVVNRTIGHGINCARFPGIGAVPDVRPRAMGVARTIRRRKRGRRSRRCRGPG